MELKAILIKPPFRLEVRLSQANTESLPFLSTRISREPKHNSNEVRHTISPYLNNQAFWLAMTPLLISVLISIL